MQQAVAKEIEIDADRLGSQNIYAGAGPELLQVETLLLLQGRSARRREKILTAQEHKAYLAREMRMRLAHALSLRTFRQRLYATLCVRGYLPESPGRIRRFVIECKLKSSADVLYRFLQGGRQEFSSTMKQVDAYARALSVPMLALRYGLRHFQELQEFMSSEVHGTYMPNDPIEYEDDDSE